MEKDAKIYVAGHRGMVGSAIVRRLRQARFNNLVLRTRQDLPLTDHQAVDAFFAAEKPDFVFMAAAKVGGIHANNTYPVDFLRENLLIELHVTEAAFRNQVKKFLFLGSSCVYPKLAPQPIQESSLLTSALEPTNEWYAIAKIAGIKLGQAYRRQYGFNAISLMPTNLYGPGDNFHLDNAHVLPALIRKFHEAKEEGRAAVEIWGTGTPYREFLHVDDFADACLFLMEQYDDAEIVNVGTGEDITIRGVAEMVQEVVGFDGELRFDPSKPDGTSRKLLDVSKLHTLGWQPRTPLRQGLASTYQWFLENQGSFRK
jgi:GDP-L-fucose synthase